MNYDLPDAQSENLAAYAVRLAGTENVVGLFVARDVNQLTEFVNEHCDPTTTEYLVLGAGGMHVVASSVARWSPAEPAYPGQEFFDAEPDVQPLDGTVLNEAWWRAVDRGTWHALDWVPLLRQPRPDEIREPRLHPRAVDTHSLMDAVGDRQEVIEE